MTITASLVKELRDKSGAGMMDCKTALTENNGDIEAAMDWLRSKGIAKAEKKSGRVAAEGLIGMAQGNTAAVLIEVNSETDFVAKNEQFQDLVRRTAATALETDGSVDAIAAATINGGDKSVADTLTDAIATIGENMTLRRAAKLAVGKGVVASYMHNAAGEGLGKIGVLVALESEGDAGALAAIGKQVAMHVAATNPLAATQDEIPADVAERERAIYTEQASESGKPAEIVENYPQLQPIASSDSVELNGTFRNIGFGEWDFGVAVSTPGDADSSNNIIVKTIFVDDPGAVDLAINEIQFAPETGFDEWVELANFGNSEINLRRLFFADSRDTVLISEEDRWLSPGELVVLAGDSTAAFQYNFPMEKLIVVRGFPSLNNDIESLRLLGPSFATYDFVPYTSEWFGRDVNRGTTLEKIRPEFNGQIATSWAASVAASGSTPAATNSVQIDLTATGESIDFSPNPFSPDSDGFEDFLIIRYRLDVATAIANVRVFDLKGRLVRHIANHEPVGSQGQFIWDGKSDDGRLMPIGSYVVYFQILNTEKRITREFVNSVVLFKR